MSRKKFAKYMIEERLEQLTPPYKIEDRYAPVICGNCYREDIIINFVNVEAMYEDRYPTSAIEGTELQVSKKPLIMKDVKCPKCRSGLAYRFKFTIVEDKPKPKKKNAKTKKRTQTRRN